jgi:hypothetical protein
MKKLFIIISLSFAFNIYVTNAQTTHLSSASVSIISADAQYLGKVRVPVSTPKKVPGKDYYIGVPAFRVEDSYLLNIYIKVSEIDTNSILPLYVKLNDGIKFIANLNELPTDEILHYEIKFNSPIVGWNVIAIGYFTKDKNIIYDEKNIYIK